MTYKQIEEEFDEKFVNTLYSTQSDVQVNVWKLIDYGNGEHKIGHYYGPDEIKSFLKQSFIKYLQSEVEFLDTKKNRFNEDTETLANAGYSIALDDISLRLQAQIQEIEA